MNIRRFFAILVALAVLVVPGVTGAVMAAPPRHDMRMVEAGHCRSPPASSGNHDKMGGKSCCIAMCMALAVAPSRPAETLPPRQQMVEFASAKAYHGLPAEIATPPPRRA